MKFNPNQRYTRWSIRRLSVGVASVVVASGFFVLVGQPASVRADQVTPTAIPVVQTEKDMSKEVKNTSEMPDKATELPMDSMKEVVTTEAPAKEEMPVETKATEPETAKKMEENAKTEVAKIPKKEAETPEMTPAPKGESPVAKEEMATSPDQVKKAVTDNVKDSTDVLASYLEKANVPGPFLAGVNQVIPYEAFGGDGMLTRLLLKAADKAPWSDNGTAGNAAILPLEGLAKGQYFYEVDLNGNTRGKEGQALLDQLRANGTQTYQATVKVYGAKDGKPDLTNVVATRQIMVQLHGKDMTTKSSQGSQAETKSSQGNQAEMDAGKDMKSETTGLNHGMENMKVNQPGQGQKVEQMMKGDKGMLPNTGEVKTNTATIGIFGLVLAGVLSLLGVKAKRDN